MADRRKRRSQAEIAASKREVEQAKVVQWATTYGAPVSMLTGWDPDSGRWHIDSPVGRMLELIGRGNFLSVAAAHAGVVGLPGLLGKGSEYAVDIPEDRAYIPVGVRPFIDLVRQVEIAEAKLESDIVSVVHRAAHRDPKLALAYLGRRFGQRWREQQAVFTSEDIDERDKAVSEAMTDPNVALELARVAEAIEGHTGRD